MKTLIKNSLLLKAKCQASTECNSKTMNWWRCCAPKQYKRYGLGTSRKIFKATLAAYFLSLYDILISVAIIVCIVKLLEVDYPCQLLKMKWAILCFNKTMRHFDDYSVIRFVLFGVLTVCGFRFVGIFLLILGICTKSASRIKPFIVLQSIFFIIIVITIIIFSSYGMPLVFAVPVLALTTAVDVYCMPMIWYFYKIYKIQKLSLCYAASTPNFGNNHTSASTSGNNEIGMRLARCHTI